MMIMKIKCKLVPEMIVRPCCHVEKMLLTVTRQIGPDTQSSFADDLRKPCRALTHGHLPMPAVPRRTVRGITGSKASLARAVIS